ncbi:MAG TPA: tRNA dihydrouridine synthase DusB [Candidatus Paceibacterota bacterium]|nr:tRNA dihydrouridine synthase DusB [Candidatus Paceibacterota bacterium]
MKKFPKLKSKAVLAPMSGVTDIAFRDLCKKYGAGLTYTEFVSSNAINQKNKKTTEMLKISKKEKPSAVQIFGSNETEIINAAKFLEKNTEFNIIDLNCGCPANKILKCGAGSELLKDPNKIARIIKQLSSQIKRPITLKVRLGINKKNINIEKIAKLAEKNGAVAITIHGRTQKQGYSGNADWKLIKQIKKQIKIPVIGNGDITNPEIFKKRLKESKVDYIMIGRAAIGNPYIFKQINDYLKTGRYNQNHNKINDLQDYIILSKKYKIPFNNVKQQSIYFTKGLKNSSQLRNQLSRTKNIEEINNLLNQLRKI